MYYNNILGYRKVLYFSYSIFPGQFYNHPKTDFDFYILISFKLPFRQSTSWLSYYLTLLHITTEKKILSIINLVIQYPCLFPTFSILKERDLGGTWQISWHSALSCFSECIFHSYPPYCVLQFVFPKKKYECRYTTLDVASILVSEVDLFNILKNTSPSRIIAIINNCHIY